MIGNQFQLAKKLHLDNDTFKHILFDRNVDTHETTATFALAKSYEDVVRHYEPVIEITIPVSEDEVMTAEPTLPDDITDAQFVIRNKMSLDGTFEITFEDFNKLLSQEISDNQDDDLMSVPHQTYKDLIFYGVPIPLRQPTTIQ